MFGDFSSQFGLQFPFLGMDPQGGMLGQNAPVSPEVGSQQLGQQGTGGTGAPPAPALQGSPTAGVGGLPSAPTAPSPLANPLAPGQTLQGPAAGVEQGPPAPAAGVGSQFGKPA